MWETRMSRYQPVVRRDIFYASENGGFCLPPKREYHMGPEH